MLRLKAVLTILGLLAITAVASGSAMAAKPERQPATGVQPLRSKPDTGNLGKAQAVAPLPPRALAKARKAAPLPTNTLSKVSSAKCRLSCVKRAVIKLADAYSSLARAHNRLVDAHNRLVGAHNALARDFNALSNDYFNCEQLVDVTQYDGYTFLTDFTTTALDYTESGDTPTDSLVTYVC